MAKWTIILFSLCGVLLGYEIQAPSVKECCQDGRDRGLGGQDCTILPLISSSLTCSITQEQCCFWAVKERLCDNGIRMARGQGACERPFFQGEPWETIISKICCDCCVLGLKQASQGLSCELHGLMLGGQCGDTLQTCCGKNTTEEMKPTPGATLKPETNVTITPTEEPDPCRDTSCSQLCVGNGTCACNHGYRLQKDGVQCEDIDECALGTHNCGPDFLCNNTEGSYRCLPKKTCDVGFVQDAAGSCIDIDECVAQTTPCPLEHTCVNTLGSYSCHRNTVACEQGYRLTPDGTRCEDVNECLTGNLCVGQGCVNLLGSFRCECKIGFMLNSNTKTCEDIDECALGTHNCGPDFLCNNTEGSFRCLPKKTCDVGFVQDATGSCIDINECVAQTTPCPLKHTCVNTLGSYSCHRNTVACGRGYRLTEDGTRCEDVNECLTGNVCVGHGCVNLLGSFRCECKIGFMLNSNTKTCEDINECWHYPGRLCAHKCVNTEGSYACSCTTGFKLSTDGRNCDDIDECQAKPCAQGCSNVFGSYNCYCHRGYQLSDHDGKTCEDIDECALSFGSSVCSYGCSNAPGSFYCSCPPTGYTLGPDGRTCQDIDECAAGRHTCSVSESCFNIQGGYRCLSFVCPVNFRKSLNSHCERVTCEFTQDPASCILLPLRISFYNISFPINTPVPTNVFRMGPSNSVPGDKMLINIVSGDEEGYFMVQQQSHGGEIALRRLLSEPRDFYLTVEMRLIRYGTSHLYMAKISVFVTNEHIIKPTRTFPF